VDCIGVDSVAIKNGLPAISDLLESGLSAKPD